MKQRITIFSRSMAMLLAIGAAPLSHVAGQEQSALDLELHSVVTADGNRWYRVFIPSGDWAGQKLPVVIGFHGGGGNARQFAADKGIIEYAQQFGFLAVFPEGTGVLSGPPWFLLETWNVGNCCGFAMENNINDVEFVDILIDDLQAKWPIDSRRVFATGISNGGMMAYRLAIELAHRIAAIGPVAASLGVTAKPPEPIPMIVFFGWLDQNVPFEGGVGSGVSGTDFLSQLESITPFLEANDAQPPSLPSKIIGEAALYRAPAVATGADIHYWLLNDGGHSWPGGPAPTWNPLEPVNGDIDATWEMLKFFSEHPKLSQP